MIEIPVKTYYNRPDIYPHMAKCVFDALEKAFIDGKETACVPADEFKKMMERIVESKNTNGNDYETTDGNDIVRAKAIF
jgi:hypothetical protein